MFSGSNLIEIRETFFFFFFSSLFCWPWPYSGLSVEAKTPTHNDYDDVNEISPIFHYLRDLDIGTHSPKTSSIGALHDSKPFVSLRYGTITWPLGNFLNE